MQKTSNGKVGNDKGIHSKEKGGIVTETRGSIDQISRSHRQTWTKHWLIRQAQRRIRENNETSFRQGIRCETPKQRPETPVLGRLVHWTELVDQRPAGGQEQALGAGHRGRPNAPLHGQTALGQVVQAVPRRQTLEDCRREVEHGWPTWLEEFESLQIRDHCGRLRL